MKLVPIFSLVGVFAASLHAAPVKVELTADGSLLRGGKPYFIKGAGGSDHLEELAKRGGNSVRTWSTTDLIPFLDKAESLGLTVSVGIWLEPECNWFSYGNPEQTAKQLAKLEKEVAAAAQHPALLAWGIGNEAEGDGGNTAYWKQMEKLVLATKKLDPNHPTFTAVAGLSKLKAEQLNAHVPSLDFVGINTYGALPRLRTTTVENGWKRPWAVTEFGTRGFWEIGKTPWGAPLEPMPQVKADFMNTAYTQAIAPAAPCIGSYAFVWGQKDEATPSWFGLLTNDGLTTPQVDVLEKLWTGKEPQNHVPIVDKLESSAATQTLAAGATFKATAAGSDKDGDKLAWEWRVISECTGRHAGNGKAEVPKVWSKSILSSENGAAEVKAPEKPGIYRLYVKITDGQGHASEANFPFRVQ